MSTLQWFTCLFAYTFQFEALQRLWDLIFIKGNTVLFSIGLAIFHELEPALMKCENLQSIVKVMDRTSQLLVDTSKFIEIVNKYEIQTQWIYEKRKEYRAEIVNELEQYRCKPNCDKFD